jgi:hypothetical protein
MLRSYFIIHDEVKNSPTGSTDDEEEESRSSLTGGDDSKGDMEHI